MQNIKNNLKYPLYLFIAILVAKIGYVVVESFYNYHVLTITTSASLTQAMLQELNENGHRISAIGITLLVVPFLYMAVKRFDPKVMIVLLLFSSVGTYFVAFEVLNKAVDKIVEINKDKRHDAYYINIFKYGILNNVFSYNSFINNDKIKSNTLDVNDKILLTNSFLLLYADEKLIDKLKQRGKQKVAELYIKTNGKDDYDTKFNQFQQLTTKITTLWNKLNTNKKRLKTELDKLDDKHIKIAYDKFVSELTQKYTKYVNGWAKVDNTIKQETAPYKINIVYDDLKKYFRYQRYSKAKRQYKAKMIENFGHYIKPSRWLNQSNKLTKTKIKEVITQEILQKAKTNFGDLPRNLSIQEFMYNDTTKLAVMKVLKKNGILIPYEFDYSFKQFKKYFKVMASKKMNMAYKEFYSKLEQQIGKNDLKLSMDYKAFIYSKYIYNQLKQNIQTKNIKIIQDALYTKDLASFKNMVYLPNVVSKVNEMMYKKADFQDGSKASKQGDEAIKLLYIPPFALSVSIIALLLNIVTVFGMLLSITSLPKKFQTALKIGLILTIIFIPVFSKYDSFENNLIQKVATTKIQIYLEFLNWISYYETINSKLH